MKVKITKKVNIKLENQSYSWFSFSLPDNYVITVLRGIPKNVWTEYGVNKIEIVAVKKHTCDSENMLIMRYFDIFYLS